MDVKSSASRFIPLAVLLLLLAGFTLGFGPRIYRSMKLHSAASAAMENARSGKLSAMASYVESSQQQDVLNMLQLILRPDYYQEIAALRVDHVQMEGADSAWVYVRCRTQGDNTGGLYQGKLLWHLANGKWEWDFAGSFAAQESFGSAPQWESLESYVRLGSQY